MRPSAKKYKYWRDSHLYSVGKVKPSGSDDEEEEEELDDDDAQVFFL
jgi:hypothetical protein